MISDFVCINTDLGFWLGEQDKAQTTVVFRPAKARVWRCGPGWGLGKTMMSQSKGCIRKGARPRNGKNRPYSQRWTVTGLGHKQSARFWPSCTDEADTAIQLCADIAIHLETTLSRMDSWPVQRPPLSAGHGPRASQTY